jgi:hypothetical protein
MPTNNNAQNVVNGYVVYYRKNGQKKAVLKNNMREVNDFKTGLYFNKRKFLGFRPLAVKV